MKGLILVAAFLILSGCSASSLDYLKIRKLCYEREGQYFTYMLPTLFGTRLGAGCLEK